MRLVKLITLILLIVLIFMIALTVKRLRDTNAVKLDNLCKNGITVPVKTGSLLDMFGGGVKVPENDQTFTIKLDC